MPLLAEVQNTKDTDDIEWQYSEYKIVQSNRSITGGCGVGVSHLVCHYLNCQFMSLTHSGPPPPAQIRAGIEMEGRGGREVKFLKKHQ